MTAVPTQTAVRILRCQTSSRWQYIIRSRRPCIGSIQFHERYYMNNSSGATKNVQPSRPSPDKYSKPTITDEGVQVYQSDPNTTSSSPGLTWGSVLWPSGVCLAKFLSWSCSPRLEFNASTARDPANEDMRMDKKIKHEIINDETRILELGCGTGIVGLTCAKLGAAHVTMSDSESALWRILRKSIDANQLSNDRIDIQCLDWRDTTTFLDHKYDLVVAADVLYAGMDGLFARALASHLPSTTELLLDTNNEAAKRRTEAIIACPYRTDSPLLTFFGIAHRLGLVLDRLEDGGGNAAGATSGVDAKEAFEDCRFVPLTNDNDCDGNNSDDCPNDKWKSVANEPTFASCNENNIQIFRVRRMRGTAAEARAIRRVGRL